MEKTVSYIESLKGAELQRKQKRCRTEKKCLKSLKKKADLWANLKGEKKIKIQGQQSRTWKETLAGKNYPEYPTQRIKL